MTQQYIFTMIEYKQGGNFSPCSCCVEVTNSDLAISNWNQDDYQYWVNVIGRKLHRDGIAKEPDYNSRTILINGIHVNQFSSEDVYEYLSIPGTEDGEISHEELTHNEYAEKFWQDVLVAKNAAFVEHKALEDAKIAKQVADAQEKERLTILKAQQAERAKYEELKLKFESSI
jgi:hypothetical protein